MRTSGIFIDNTPKIREGLNLVQGLSLDADGDKFRFFVDNLDFCFSYVDGEAKLFTCCMLYVVCCKLLYVVSRPGFGGQFQIRPSTQCHL